MASSIPLRPIACVELPQALPRMREVRKPLDVHERAREVARALVDDFPEELQAAQRADVDRVAFHAAQAYVPGGAIADLGGGLGLFAPVCAALGMDAFLIDDFGDPVNEVHHIEDIAAHRKTGVEVLKTEVDHWGESFADESLDIVTSFDSIEHWHHSPRRALLEASRVLRPGGCLLLGLPNAVNLRKRIAVLLGRSNWSGFEDWYYPDEFRGHVREPVLGDVLRMVADVGLEHPRVWGRNWSGTLRGGAAGLLARLIDWPLRARPTLCSDLYVMAIKPA